jgi:hypothetical protein
MESLIIFALWGMLLGAGIAKQDCKAKKAVNFSQQQQQQNK